jgi:hypothetical protein
MVYNTQNYWFLEYRTMDEVQKPSNSEDSLFLLRLSAETVVICAAPFLLSHSNIM